GLEFIGCGLETEQTLYPGTKQNAVMGLGAEVVTTRLNCPHTVAGIVESGKEDHRNTSGARSVLDAATDFKACGTIVHSKRSGRHRNVQDTEIRLPAKTECECRRTIFRGHHPIAEIPELLHNDLDVRGDIVSNQYQRRRLILVVRP